MKLLTLKQQIDLAIEIKRRELYEGSQEKYAHSLVNFVRDAWHIVEPATEYVHGWHIDAICEHLQGVTDGKIKNLLINIPPGMLKSLLVGVFWPAWEWGARKLAHLRYICAAHSQALAIRDNIKCRRLITSEWYQDRFPNVKLLGDQNAKIKFENTDLGFREAIAAGSITGSRGDRVILDDPLSVADSYSETIRESKALWFTEGVPTRLNDIVKSSIVVVMQRLHDRDTSGIILEQGLPYEHLCLPMEFDSLRKCSTKIGFIDPRTKDGDLLFPERLPREAVDRLKENLGEYATAGQLQQTPVPRGGGIIKRSWCQILEVLPENFTYIIQSYDTAFKTKENNDYSVGTTWGILNENIYLIDRLKGKYEYPELLEHIKDNAKKYSPNIILIEDKASGQSLIQSLKRETRLSIKEVKVDTDKVVRAHAVTSIFEHGRVFVKNSSWTDDYLNVLTKFPYAAHDDDVDSTTMALSYFAKLKNCFNVSLNGDVFTR